MKLREPLLEAYAARIKRTDKMSAKRSWLILQEQEHKNVTPKFENTITHTYGAIEGDYTENY